VSRLTAALQLVTSHLASLDRQWALVGGLAVSARSEPRFTRDIDVAVAVANDADAESLVHALVARGYRMFASLEQEDAGRLAAVRLLSPGEGETGVVVDLLFASSGIEPELTAAAETLEVLPGLGVPVARLGHLLALKALAEDARRPQDRADVVALLAAADDAELERARHGAALISERGFGRGKDVPAVLEALIRSGG
jgi:hypothetical protein